MLTSQHAFNTYDDENPKIGTDIHSIVAFDRLQLFRISAGIYGLLLSSIMLYFAGIWPFASYTMTSWNLMSVHFLSAYYGASGSKVAGIIAGTSSKSRL